MLCFVVQVIDLSEGGSMNSEMLLSCRFQSRGMGAKRKEQSKEQSKRGKGNNALWHV
jgi:hypothetical protein